MVHANADGDSMREMERNLIIKQRLSDNLCWWRPHSGEQDEVHTSSTDFFIRGLTNILLKNSRKSWVKTSRHMTVMWARVLIFKGPACHSRLKRAFPPIP